jgi:hypothetical protein
LVCETRRHAEWISQAQYITINENIVHPTRLDIEMSIMQSLQSLGKALNCEKNID